MLCKLTSKNQITLPKELLEGFAGREYFDARLDRGRIILEPMIVRPVESARLSAIRDKVEAAGIRETAVDDLVAEARHAYGP